MRADNKGEGGILSLVVLVEHAAEEKGRRRSGPRRRRRRLLLRRRDDHARHLGALGRRGLAVINPGFESYVVPLTLAVLFSLFLFQYRGTGGVASLFAPVTALWFVVIGMLGLVHIGDDPTIFYALNPTYGFRMLVEQPGLALLVFGGVFLAVTGGEALYADMGHFGRTPIRLAWICVVFPALILNYLGQGAFVIAHPQPSANPFFLMAPSWALIPLVVLATLVTVIASQAVITGAFSIAQQAISLGLLPRMNITHTSETEQGQIYIGQINWLIFAGVVLARPGLPLLVQPRLRLWHRRQHLDDHRHDAGPDLLLEGADPSRYSS